MPVMDYKTITDPNHRGHICGLMQSVRALEEYVKKLRFERSARMGLAVGRQMEVTISNDGSYRSQEEKKRIKSVPCVFRMPLHYPRYRKVDYEAMPEWKLDNLFREYGLPVIGDLPQKRNYAIGAFLWPDEVE